ncbi:DNA topoisomerase IV, alpha subunit [Glonium stellatum]|uniref:DNA topoisomerase (ATP-hydrolyzing) n=1 Tax=Glonium stellatum TaxID=574774 RepID=A0A8E2JRX8_9PEZI|nr:DNA topoisomerase IV, alpha subunit [Glonium stellatum]
MLFGASLLEDSSQESLTDEAYFFEDLLETPATSSTLTSPQLLESPIAGKSLENALRLNEDALMLDAGQPQFTGADELLDAVQGPQPIVRDRDWVIARIESIFEGIVDALLEKKTKLSITLSCRSGTAGRTFDSANGIVTTATGLQTREITFPGSTAQEAWRFTVLVRILEIIHDALIADVIVTKRDIYYRHPDLFVKQAVVDRYVDDLACTFGVSRTFLNVSAAAKGLVAGNFTIQRADGSQINGLKDREGLLVPNLHSSDTIDMSNVQWILLVEKEATFRSLVHSDFWILLSSQGVILTAKGYPDLSTRIFLSYLTSRSSHIPTYAIVDYDPDGLAILSTYKHGSYALAHENSRATSGSAGGRQLNLPRLQWVGVRSHHLQPPASADNVCAERDTRQTQGLMKLTRRDRCKARRMLEREAFVEDGVEAEWRSELQIMLMLNIKAEMQIFEERQGGLGFWLMEALEPSAKPPREGLDDERVRQA